VIGKLEFKVDKLRDKAESVKDDLSQCRLDVMGAKNTGEASEKAKYKVGTGCAHFNGTVSDEPRQLLRHQRAQAHNSTLYRRQHSFMYWLSSKQNCLLWAYKCDFGDNDRITIV
jgi:hypothetical protein